MIRTLKTVLSFNISTNESRHVIFNNVAFWDVKTQTSMCSLLLGLNTPNDVRSVA